jgi:hypothetical protein
MRPLAFAGRWQLPTAATRFPIASAGWLLLAVFAALSLAAGLWPVATALAVAAFWFSLFAWLTRGDPRLRDLVFWLLFTLTLTVELVHKRTGVSVGLALEGVMLLALPFAMGGLADLDGPLRRLFWLIAAFVVISVLSAVFGQSPLVAAAFQMATDLKFIVLLLIGLYLSWSARTERNFWRVVRWLWLPMLLLVIWQWGAPGSYFSHLHTTYGGQEDPLGLVPTRALGPYNHSGQFAAVLAVLWLLTLVRGRLGDRSLRFAGLGYFGLLLGTTQRVEIGSAMAVALWLLLTLRRPSTGAARGRVWPWLAALAGMTLLAGGPLLQERLERDVEYREFTGEAQPYRPRPVYYLTSMHIASVHAPLGSGPGTFAGAGAGKFNWDYYQRLGFFGYSWFSPMYMFETYWPHFIAEGGWGGFLAYLLFIVGLVRYAFRQADAVADPAHRGYWLMAAGSLSYLLLTSLNGPTFEDPQTAFLAATLFGVAYRYRKPGMTGGND